MKTLLSNFVSAAVLFSSFSAHAALFRLPLSADTAFHYYYDHNSSSGIQSWKCGAETYNGHRGTDFSGVARGRAIYAAAVGTVDYKIDGFGDGFWGSTDGGGFGNYVRLAHTSGLVTYYGHMTINSVTTQAVGSAVACSDQIGGVGTSGNSSGLHLHFEPQLNGTAFDPFSGACSGSTSWWVNQGSGSPSTDCEERGCVDDAYEQDDTAGAAKTIAGNETQNRTICLGDEDWASFTVSTANSGAVVRTDARSGFTGGDTEMWLYGPNSSTTRIGYNDDFTGSWSQLTVSNLAVGTYYVRVRELGNDAAIPGYTLYLNITPPPPPPCVDDAYEQDDTAGAAKTIAGNETQNRTICLGDEDWASFTVSTANSGALVRTDARGGLGGGDTEMWLYGPNSSTTQIGFNDDFTGLWSQLTVSNLAVGKYYVRVRELGNNAAIPGYTLYLDITPPPPPSLGYTRQGNTLLLSWPTNDPAFKLEYATNLLSTNLAGSTWTSNPVFPSVVSGQYIATNVITGDKRFYRLEK